MRLAPFALLTLAALALTACPKDDEDAEDTGETDETDDTSESDDTSELESEDTSETDDDEMPCAEAFAGGNQPVQIESYTWEGHEVYLASFGCCDFFDEVYDAGTCERLCAPSGGIAGSGDGQCPDFYEDATHNGTAWKAQD